MDWKPDWLSDFLVQNIVIEDKIADQMSLKEYIDPFTDSKETKA